MIPLKFQLAILDLEISCFGLEFKSCEFLRNLIRILVSTTSFQIPIRNTANVLDSLIWKSLILDRN